MNILENYDLTKFNTFGVKASADFFVELNNEEELNELMNSPVFKNNEKLFLGGGSNVLFTKDFKGIVVLNKLKGIKILKETDDEVFIRSMGGEKWNDLVNFTTSRDYWGIENLSLIPGTAGAAPVQNIGAYGVEIKDVVENVEAYNLDGEKKVFSKEECLFEYRSSIFKKSKKYFISAIVLKLSKVKKEKINYLALTEFLEKNKIEIKTSKDVSDAVAEIRKSKLPNPQETGNAGSFFKNIYIDHEKAKKIKSKFADIPLFEENDMIKVPAGWLIEQCGWKGKRIGNVGVHEKQALVLVNHGGATGEEVKNLSIQIISSVFDKFGLKLETEVNLIS